MKNVISNEDCLEGMKNIPDKSIDLILCDLPYGETGHKWDKILPLDKLWDEYQRIIKDHGAIVLFGSLKLGFKLYNIVPDLYRYEWVWKKNKGTNFLNSKYQPLRFHEYIFIFGKGIVNPCGKRVHMNYFPQMKKGKAYIHKYKLTQEKIWNGKKIKRTPIICEDGLRYPQSVLEYSKDTKCIHPSQKPIPLLEYLIKTYTKEGDIVLDNCMGSGSTIIACINTDRNFIGFEVNPKIYKTARKRIEDCLEGGDICGFSKLKEENL